MKTGLCGNIALNDFATQLDRLMPSCEIIVGRKDEFRNELAWPQGDFTCLDTCIIALDWSTLAPSLYGFVHGDDDKAVVAAFSTVCDGIKTVIEKFRAVCQAKILLFSPVSECGNPSGFLNRILNPSPIEVFTNCQELFNDLCRSFSDIYPIDMEEICSRIGKDNAFDPVMHYEADQPFAPVMTNAIAAHIAAMMTQFRKYPLKCLVLDCDNTLWGGVVGEIGAANLVLGDNGPGKAFKDFQAEIVRLHKQGVILAVCSKNNTCDALEVIEQHPHMVIRPPMISCYRINWDDKPKNMIGISEELNIGLTSMMFADDSPAERGMMRAALPDVEILELPDNPAYYADTLKRCTRFWPIQLTKDDAKKGVFFTQDRLRKQAQELAANIEEYLVKSDISVTVARANAASFPRITQLFNKTNQFNLTTRRYSQNELEGLALDPVNRLFSMAMKDRFGDYGIIASALVRGDIIDSFLLSCRVFGKHAEQAFLVRLMGHCKKAGCDSVFGRYIPSAKNSMTKDFYKDMGFAVEKESKQETLWRFDLNRPLPQIPRWISVTSDL